MTLGELLEELRRNILHDRSDRVAGVDDRLWSDQTLVRYIDEAQRRLARLGLVIREGRNPLTCRVQLVADQTEYDLHPSIIAVVSARLSQSQVDLTRLGHTVLNMVSGPDVRIIDPSMFTGLPPGRVVAYSTDEELASTETDSFDAPVLRVYPAPRADLVDVVHMRVVRMPLERLSADNLDAVPEVPSDFHLAMLDWAAYLALRVADVDAGMPRIAQVYQANFAQVVKEARLASMRKMFAPKPWGFGQNGWVWET